MKFCDAIEWRKIDEGGKDYVECSDLRDVWRCRLEGLMLSVEVNLCATNRKHFERHSDWATIKVVLLEKAGVGDLNDRTNHASVGK